MKLFSPLIFFLVFMFSLRTAHHTEKNLFIVWNVGQGTWQSLVTKKQCHHIDLGGEKSALEKIWTICRGRKNSFSISHWDWDHFSFLRPTHRRLKDFCRSDLPQMNSRKAKKYRLRKCSSSPNSVQIIFRAKNKKKWSKNDQSTVHLVMGQILVPGDSTKKMEKLWIQRLSGQRPQVLILGHHGSNTSTSKQLLKALPSLRQAIASARRSRYGHPHPKVKSRLKKAGLALLSTEDWGSIAIETAARKN